MICHHEVVQANAASLHRSVEDICQLPGVLGVHEVHVWELAKDRNVASMHVKVTADLESSKGEIRHLHMQIREVFHRLGVHSITVQIEFSDEEMENRHCGTPCISYDCLRRSCCPADLTTQNRTDLHKVNNCSSREVTTVFGEGSEEERRTQHGDTILSLQGQLLSLN